MAVLGAFAVVIAMMTPVYFDDLRLHQYLISLTHDTAPDETVRAEVMARARQLDLPLRAQDVHVLHAGGKTKIELKYTVEMTVLVYPVDLHFPTIR